MSISPDTMSDSLDNGTQALEYLRGRPNPFENLVRPQRPDDRFLDVHIPELVREQRELALAVIDAYRLAAYRSVNDLPDSRVVTILGRAAPARRIFWRPLPTATTATASFWSGPLTLRAKFHSMNTCLHSW